MNCGYRFSVVSAVPDDVRSNAAAGTATIGLAASKFGRAMRVPVTTTSSSDWSSALAESCQTVPASSQNPHSAIRTGPRFNPPELTSAPPAHRVLRCPRAANQVAPGIFFVRRPPPNATARRSPRIEARRGSRRRPDVWPVSASRRRDTPCEFDDGPLACPAQASPRASPSRRSTALAVAEYALRRPGS